MRPSTRAALTAATLLTASCGAGNGPSPGDFDQAVGAYWDQLDTEQRSAICITLTDWEWSGFRLIAEHSDTDGRIDLLAGGSFDDTHDNRIAIGHAFDRLAAEQC